jgi:hypothetical protein
MRSKQEVCFQNYGIRDARDHKFRKLWLDDTFSPRLPPAEQWFKMQLPYEAPEHPLLSTQEEIVRSMMEKKVGHHHAGTVCRARDCFVKRKRCPLVVQVRRLPI